MRTATEGAIPRGSPIPVTVWEFHDPRAPRVGAVVANLALVAFLAVFWVIGGPSFAAGWVVLLIAVDITFAVVFFTNRGWSGNWSVDALLPGDLVRSAVVQALTEGGFSWGQGSSLNVSRYFRHYTGPIEVLAPTTQLWLRTWTFRDRKRALVRHVTAVVLRPLRAGEDLDPLKAAVLARLRTTAGEGGVTSATSGTASPRPGTG